MNHHCKEKEWDISTRRYEGISWKKDKKMMITETGRSIVQITCWIDWIGNFTPSVTKQITSARITTRLKNEQEIKKWN